MPRPKGYGRALRAASDAVRQERMVVGEVKTGASSKKPKAAKPGANARRKAAGAAPRPANTRSQTPTASDWSQALGLLMHRCSPATREEVTRVAEALAAEVKSPGRRAVYVAVGKSAARKTDG